jgi:hypothetical protein
MYLIRELYQLMEAKKPGVPFKELPFPIVAQTIKGVTGLILNLWPNTPHNRDFAEYKAERFIEDIFHELMDVDSEEELKKFVDDYSNSTGHGVGLWIDNLWLNLKSSENNGDDWDDDTHTYDISSDVAQYFEDHVAPDLEKNWQTYKEFMEKRTGVTKERATTLTWTDLESPAQDEREIIASYKGRCVALITLQKKKWHIQLSDGVFGVPKKWKGVHFGLLSKKMAETLGIKYDFSTLPDAKAQVEMYASDGGMFMDKVKKQPKIADIVKAHGEKRFH